MRGSLGGGGGGTDEVMVDDLSEELARAITIVGRPSYSILVKRQGMIGTAHSYASPFVGPMLSSAEHNAL